jgi:pyruvate formate lyase activating enzyme
VRIGGLLKTTLLDFPGKISAMVFTQGCNFLCPYCHNPELTVSGPGNVTLAGLIDFLTKRAGVLEGVVISGGEPTLHAGLPDFCATLKSLGLSVKLDTNGSRPEVLQSLLDAKLLDYIAMDVKGDPRRYPEELGAPAGFAALRSMRLIRESGAAHEFRVPCAAPFIDARSFATILGEIGGAPLFLQTLRLDHVLRPEFFAGKGRSLDNNEMESLRAMATRWRVDCRLR